MYSCTSSVAKLTDWESDAVTLVVPPLTFLAKRTAALSSVPQVLRATAVAYPSLRLSDTDTDPVLLHVTYATSRSPAWAGAGRVACTIQPLVARPVAAWTWVGVGSVRIAGRAFGFHASRGVAVLLAAAPRTTAATAPIQESGINALMNLTFRLFLAYE